MEKVGDRMFLHCVAQSAVAGKPPAGPAFPCDAVPEPVTPCGWNARAVNRFSESALSGPLYRPWPTFPWSPT